jgi:ABC-type multidrug transport system ATPase subunit
MLVSTHRLHEIERRANRFVILHDGRVVRSGTRDELLDGLDGTLEDAYFRAVCP